MDQNRYNQIQVTLSNGGMDKEARILLKQGRKVLELRSKFTTSFMGKLRHTFEAVIWQGYERRSGVTATHVEQFFRLGDDVKVEPVPGYPDHFPALLKASEFTPEELHAGVSRHFSI